MLASSIESSAQSTSSYGSTATQVKFVDSTSNGSGLNNTGYEPAITYPVPIQVSGFTGSVSTVSVTISDIHDALVNGGGLFEGSFFLLVSPDGRAFDFVGQPCINTLVPAGDTITFSDSGSNVLQTQYYNCASITNNASYLPEVDNLRVDFTFVGAFSKPSGATWSTSLLQSQGYLAATGYWPVGNPQGSSTFTSVYQGMSASEANGTWYLYWAISDNGAAGTITIGDGTHPAFTLNITSSTAPSSSTVVNSSVNPVTVTPPATSSNSTVISATVTPNPGAGQAITFVDISNPASSQNLSCGGGGDSVNTNSSGVADCAATFTTEGAHVVQATFGGNSLAGPSSGTVTEIVDWGTTNPTTGQYCNTGTVSIPLYSTGSANGLDPASAFPSTVTVSGLTGVIRDLTFSMTLDGLDPGAISALLVSPANATALEIWSYAGGGGSVADRNITLDDNASAGHPTFLGSVISSGTYQPTSNLVPFNPNAFCLTTVCNGVTVTSQPPASFDQAGPAGQGSLIGDFGGLDPNDTWQLFIQSRLQDQMSITQWCLNITTTNGTATHTVLQSSSVESTTGSSVTLTATVTTNGDSIGSNGTVTFLVDGTAIPSGSGIAVTNGQAVLATTALTEGTHNLSARFEGTSSLGPSTSPAIVHRVDDAPTPAVTCGPSGSCTAQFCNDPAAGVFGVFIPQPAFLEGAGSPYPSNILVSNVPGTLSDVTVTLNQFQTEGPNIAGASPNSIASLLTGPNGGNIDFFSNVNGGSSTVNPINLTFSDSGSSIVIDPQSGIYETPFPSGTFKPTSWGPNNNGAGPGNNPYPACPPAISCSTPPIGPPAPATGNINYAQPAGSATLDGAFSNANPNGTWSLYEIMPQDSGQIAIGSWCVNFTENRPTVGITIPSTSTFTQGQPGVSIGPITVANTTTGPKAGPTGGVLQVAMTMPNPGLTPTGTGTGSDASWSCSVTGRTITCSNSTDVAAGGNYPALFIGANVDNNAPTSPALSLSATAKGGGALGSPAATSNSDSVTILPAPVLAIQKNHSGTFTQGQTAEWDISVSNTQTGSTTYGTVTVTDALPSGYSVSSFGTTQATWTCSGTTTVSCTSTLAVAGGGAYPEIQVIVNVPAASLTSVNNTASAYGGGDINHYSSGTALASAADQVAVVQVPAYVNITAGGTQSAFVGTAFATALTAVVQDAGHVAIANYTPVTFTAPSTGASGTFSNSSATKTDTANASGQVSETFTANSTTGSYMVSVKAGSITSNFNLTNSTLPAFTKAFGPSTINVGQNTTLTFTISNPSGSPTMHNLSFSDPFPAGIAVASTPGGSATCSANGSLAATAAATSVSYSGGAVPGGSSCTISLNVTGTAVTTGAVTNTTGDLNSTETGTTTLQASAPITVNAAQHQLQLIVSPAGEGTAIPNPTNSTGLTAGNYTPGAGVQLTATPITGYVFVNWSGSTDLSSTTTDPTTLTMNTNETVTANFTAGPTSLGGSVGLKSGSSSARVWPTTVGNNGPGVALNTEATSFALVQTKGTACTPVVATTFPLAFGTIAPQGTATQNVTIDFSGCSGTVMFKLTVALSANSGAATGSIIKLNQLP